MDTIKRKEKPMPELVETYTTFWGKYSEEICGAIFIVGSIILVGVALAMDI